MSTVGKKMLESSDKKRFIVFWFFRFLILSLVIIEFSTNRTEFQLLYVTVFLFSFVPSAIKKIFGIALPLPFELLYLGALFVTILSEKIFSGLLVQFVLGVFFGIFGFLLLYILYYNSRVQTSPLLITVFSFSFSVSASALWIVFVYLLQIIFDIEIEPLIINHAPIGLLLTVIGAGIVSTAAFFYVSYGQGTFLEGLLRSFMKKNPDLFLDTKISSDKIIDLIDQGESERLEFKSSLRVNLYTRKPDKNIEFAVLKTITAFLNTDGGTLLIGVADDGGIVGIDHDGFTNVDKFYQHYTNLVQNHIGNQYLPLIKSALIQIDDGKTMLKVDCLKSQKPVFLKMNDEDFFFVRIGPASVRLADKKLLEYVNKKF